MKLVYLIVKDEDKGQSYLICVRYKQVNELYKETLCENSTDSINKQDKHFTLYVRVTGTTRIISLRVKFII